MLKKENLPKFKEDVNNYISKFNVKEMKPVLDIDMKVQLKDISLDLVKELNISSHVKFFGKQSNVFPFYKLADAVLLSSFREGNPVVYLEAKILKKPIITTNVSDALLEIDGFGIVTEFDEEAYYLGVKKFLDNGYKITKKFNPVKYDKDVLKKLDKIIGG